MKPLRVLLLITNLGKGRAQGGAQRVFYDHALAFSASYEVEEAVFDWHQDQRIYDSGLPLHDLRSNDFLSRLGPMGRLLSRALALRKLVSDGNFDLVISHLDGANWVNVLSGAPVHKILVLHGSVLFDQGQSRIRRWFRIQVLPFLIYRRAAVTVAVSEGVARELKEACHIRNVVSINNFFDLQVIRRLANETLSASESAVFSTDNLLITSGRLTPGKCQSTLLEMTAELKRRGGSVCLVVLGDGESRNQLLKLSKGLGLKTFDVWNQSEILSAGYDVYFMGFVSNPYKYLQRSTLFLFPSAWEGFPLALCEAMICGAPVLSADCPTGPREILAPASIRDKYDLRSAEMTQNGVLLPMIESQQDLEVWVDAVEKLLGDATQQERLRVNAAQAMKALDRDAVVGQWQQLIESVCHS